MYIYIYRPPSLALYLGRATRSGLVRGDAPPPCRSRRIPRTLLTKRMFNELTTSDCKLRASIEGSKCSLSTQSVRYPPQSILSESVSVWQPSAQSIAARPPHPVHHT